MYLFTYTLLSPQSGPKVALWILFFSPLLYSPNNRVRRDSLTGPKSSSFDGRVTIWMWVSLIPVIHFNPTSYWLLVTLRLLTWIPPQYCIPLISWEINNWCAYFLLHWRTSIIIVTQLFNHHMPIILSWLDVFLIKKQQWFIIQTLFNKINHIVF